VRCAPAEQTKRVFLVKTGYF